MTPDPADLRREILRALYQRRAAALSAGHLSTILSRRTGDRITPDQVNVELKFLTGRKLTEANEDPMGSAVYHSLSAEGILYCERNDLAD